MRGCHNVFTAARSHGGKPHELQTSIAQVYNTGHCIQELYLYRLLISQSPVLLLLKPRCEREVHLGDFPECPLLLVYRARPPSCPHYSCGSSTADYDQYGFFIRYYLYVCLSVCISTYSIFLKKQNCTIFVI